MKTKGWEDAQGRVREEKKSTFGCKLYAVSDCEIPAVLALQTVTGSTSDQTMVGRMLDELGRVFEPGVIEPLSMDKGFDSEDSIRSVYSGRILPVVPVRDVPRDLDQLPAKDREVRVEGTDNIVRDRYTGEVACYDTTGESPRREPMVYAGFEADRGTHEFRCPLRALGRTCPERQAPGILER